jgi:23S rRNA (uracil1939-C5)-methyltransferase
MHKSGKSHKTFTITIDKLVYEGAGLGRHRGKVIFVPFSVPGDRLLARAVEVKSKFTRAEIVRILEPGPGRVDPVCPYFGKCGGCHWQQLNYRRQVDAKREILEEILHHRFSGTRELPINMTACPQPFSYRSRARVQLRGSGPRSTIGFFRHGSRSVEDIESCPLFRPSLNQALAALRRFKIQIGCDPGMREMDIACSEESGTWDTVPCRSGVDKNTEDTSGSSSRSEEVFLQRAVGEFLYSLTAPVFFQANDFMVPELVSLVLNSATNGRNDSALDLYAGVGLYSLPLARHFQQVIAVEYSPDAARLCTKNASNAGLVNVQTVCADVATWMNSVGDSEFSIVVLNPPRTGAGSKVMERIAQWAPETIIYVSCNPLTLVRDISRIPAGKYKVDLAEGLDLFPQTFHFETIVRLVRI